MTIPELLYFLVIAIGSISGALIIYLKIGKPKTKEKS